MVEAAIIKGSPHIENELITRRCPVFKLTTLVIDASAYWQELSIIQHSAWNKRFVLILYSFSHVGRKFVKKFIRNFEVIVV